jgi:hypothetical protein
MTPAFFCGNGFSTNKTDVHSLAPVLACNFIKKASKDALMKLFMILIYGNFMI